MSERKVAKSGSGLADIVNSWTYHTTFNKPITHTDGRNNQTTYSLDAATGNLLTIQRPMVGGFTPTVTMTWNTRGQILTRTDETSIVTQWNYDATTEKLNSVVVDQGAGRLNLTTSFGYTNRGDVNSVTDPRGKQTVYDWDVKRRLTQKTDPSPLSYVTKFSFDASDNLWKIERQTGDVANPWQTFTATFNYADQLKSVTNPRNDVSTWDYDSLRRLWKFTDAESRVWERAYDAASRLYTVKDPALDIVETRLYSNNGKLASIKDARNNTTSYSRDGHDRLDRTTYADSSYEQNQSYDANDNVLVYRTRSGNTITRTFDVLNREATRAPQGQATVTLTYDLAGRLTKASKPVVSGDPSTGDIQFFFDGAGRFFKEQYPDGKVVQHVLDANGNITKTTWPDSYFVDRVWDELNRLVDIKLNGSGTAAAHFDWDALSRRKKLTYQNGVVTDYSYQLDDDLASIVHTFVGSGVTFTPGYDRTHKMISQAASDANFVWSPAATISTTYGTADSVNKYPTVGGVSYSYNGNGCLTGDSTWTFGYDTENHLLTASKTGVSVTNLYDPVHRQREHQVGSTKNRYVYAGWQRIADYDGATDTLQNRYVYGTDLDDVLIKVASGGTLTYHSLNHQGSVVALSNSAGAATNTYKYSPFAVSPSLTGTTHGYTGQRFESESGLYYYKARYYSPGLARFLQPDPIGYRGGDLNLYTYVKNDPLNLTDPFGLEALHGKVSEDVGEHSKEQLEKMDQSERNSYGDLNETANPEGETAAQQHFPDVPPPTNAPDGGIVPYLK
ncbi:MAG: RHS repeat-associated core domain-containing protein [Candidatus Obscuribacterales bacterium]|nr:RHS repeat-associated core domain-containing protein [Candidatus Obscuribacterales bacterium]